MTQRHFTRNYITLSIVSLMLTLELFQTFTVHDDESFYSIEKYFCSRLRRTFLASALFCAAHDTLLLAIILEGM